MMGRQIIQMAVRMVLRKLINHGMRASLDKVTGAETGRKDPQAEQHNRAARVQARRSRRAMRMLRRVGRF